MKSESANPAHLVTPLLETLTPPPKAAATLRVEEPDSAGMLRAADVLLQNAIRNLQDPSRDRAEDVHDVRTTIKQLRTILRLLRPPTGGLTFRLESQRLRKIAQGLAPMREASVGIQSLKKLARQANHDDREALATVEACFAEHIGRPHAIERERILRETAVALEDCRQRLLKWPEPKDDTELIEQNLEQLYSSCRRQMKEAFASPTGKRFHRWRMRVKNLSYALQLLVPIWPKKFRLMVRALDQIQKKMGDDHDLTVLEAALREAPTRFGGRKVVKCVLQQLEKRSHKLRQACLPKAAKVFHEKPRSFVKRLKQHFQSSSQDLDLPT